MKANQKIYGTKRKIRAGRGLWCEAGFKRESGGFLGGSTLGRGGWGTAVAQPAAVTARMEALETAVQGGGGCVDEFHEGSLRWVEATAAILAGVSCGFMNGP